MAGNLLFVLLSATCVSYALCQCYPTFDTKPHCTNERVPGWVFWGSMQYKYFPKQLTKNEANDFCKDWDEEVCLGETKSTGLYLGYLASYVAKNEDSEALQEAYNQACIRQGNYFWLGASRRNSYKELVYTDSQTSSLNNFANSAIPYLYSGECVAMNGNTGEMVVRPCSDHLGFVCKIQPNSH